jgi:hypothetical protein
MKTIFKTLALLVMFGIFAAPVTMATATVEEQPHMKAALEHLRLAKAELEQAEADKGGHRVAALKPPMTLFTTQKKASSSPITTKPGLS